MNGRLKKKRSLAEEVTGPAQSEYIAPKLFAPKKGGSLRFCLNYRKRNAASKWEVYLILRLDKYIELLGEATVFSSEHTRRGTGKSK